MPATLAQPKKNSKNGSASSNGPKPSKKSSNGNHDIQAIYDVRDWIELLKSEGEYREIDAKVDWNLELAAVTRHCMNAKGPALMFNNIKDHEKTWCKRVFANSLGTYERVALAFGLPKNIGKKEMVMFLKEAYKKRLAPIEVSTAAHKKNVIKGKDIDLNEIPVPMWHSWDGGRYINTFAPVITRDPVLGTYNMGIYRGMIADKNHVSCLLALSQGWGDHYNKSREQNKELKVAFIYGTHPLLNTLAGSPFGRKVQEYEVFGGITGKPLELVKCETSDLMVPASAEMVIEGTISMDRDTYMMEGPFAEHIGYYGGIFSKKPTMRVDAITYRDDPIFQGCVGSIRPGWPNEEAYIVSLSTSALVWNYLEEAGIPGITDVWMNLNSTYFTIYVQIRQSYRNQAKQIASALWGMSFANWAFKIVMVVEEDIDIRDPDQLDWAMCSRVNPGMGGITVFDHHFGSVLDPSTPFEERDLAKSGTGKWSRLLIDATRNWDLGFRPFWNNQPFPPIVVLTKEEDDLVKSRWKEYGLADINYVPRMEIDKNEDLKYRYSLKARPSQEYLDQMGKKGFYTT